MILVILLAAVGAVFDVYGEGRERHSDPDAWARAPLGIRITSCSFDRTGVDISFDTDLQPPYVVGIYRNAEYGLGRYYPVTETTTAWKHVRVPVPTMDVSLFVQVMTPSACIPRTTNCVHRMISNTEWEQYRNEIRNAPVKRNDDPSYSFERLQDDPSMWLVSDETWVGFRETDLPDVTFTFSGRTNDVESIVSNRTVYSVKMDWATYLFAGTSIPSSWKSPKANWANRKTGTYTNGTIRTFFSDAEPTDDAWYYNCATIYRDRYDGFREYTKQYTNGLGEISTAFGVYHYYDPSTRQEPLAKPIINWKPSELVTWSSSVSGADTSVGTGYRVLFFSDRNTVMVQRAYSARTNMSDEVFIDRGFRSLSTHNGYRYTMDFDGRLYFQADTNAVPDRIYLEGL